MGLLVFCEVVLSLVVSESIQSAKHAWEAVLGDLQLRVTRPSYETWLRGTVGLANSNGQFLVGTPDAFVAAMLEGRMYPLISRSLGRIMDGTLDIRFQVLSQDPTPASTVNTLGDSRPISSRSVPNNPSLTFYGGSKANPRYTFESYIVGKFNELAAAAALAVSERPGLTYNPLFIYSRVGLGKTHLLHAIGHRMVKKGLSLVYRTTEAFTNEYVSAIREGKTEEFRVKYRGADALLLDDIQFIIGKEQTQEGFFHTFNSLHMDARQIIITSDRPVSELSLLEDRVRSRLAGGLVVDIQIPDLETRIAILSAKAEAAGYTLSPEVLQLLAENVHENIRELEGILNRVVAYAKLTTAPITPDLVKRSLEKTFRPVSARRISDHHVLDAVSAYFSIDKQVLCGPRRDKQTALARHVAMFVLREEGNQPLTTIGRLLGGRDHSTVLHACQRISSRLNTDSHLRRDVINIRNTLAKA